MENLKRAFFRNTDYLINLNHIALIKVVEDEGAAISFSNGEIIQTGLSLEELEEELEIKLSK